MIPMIASATARGLGCRPGMISLASTRQKLAQQSNRSFHKYRDTHFSTSPRTNSNLESIKLRVTRRFLSTGGAKPGQSKPKTLSEAPVSPFSKFWKSFLGPKPMPERWSAAWYREMVLICTVFAITGSSTMVLVSLNHNLEGESSLCEVSHANETRFPMNSYPFLLCVTQYCPITYHRCRFDQQFRRDWA